MSGDWIGLIWFIPGPDSTRIRMITHKFVKQKSGQEALLSAFVISLPARQFINGLL